MLQGRDREREAVAALLDGARAGRGGALVLRGIAGVGKSSLLADAVHAAGDMIVLRTVGVESESPLAFAGLQRLLRPVMDRLGAVPARQADALRAALGESSAAVPDRFVIYLATLSLLVEAADERPVLVVADDAQWLDEASAGALLFVARRLEIERVAVVLAAREGDVRTFEAGDLPTVELGGLGLDAATALLAARTGRVVPVAVAEALVRATDGNALALVELAEVLPAASLTGDEPLPDPLPLTEGVERAFLTRYRRLPPAARTVLLAAAADDSGRLTVLTRVASDLGAEDGLETAERSGLLHVDGVAAELHHPLVRSAVYGSATTAERRRVHRALAAATDVDPDRRAWHLAAAATGPDAAVVAELDRAAERARRRGGHEAASAAWERAAELCAGEKDRALRLHRAASSAWQAALPERARNLANAAHANDPGLRADLVRLRGQIEFNTGSVATGHRLVLEGAAEVAPHDPHRAAEMAMLAAALAAFGSTSHGGPDPAVLVPAPSPETPLRDRCIAELVRGLAAVVRGDWPTAGPSLRRAISFAPQLGEEADTDLLINLGVATAHLGDDELALTLHDRLLADARASGSVFNILHALTRRHFAEIASGRWSQGRSAAQEAVALAQNTGYRGAAVLPTAVLALLAARRGEDARALVAEAETLAAANPQGVLAASVEDLLTWARVLGTDPEPARTAEQLGRLRNRMVSQLAAIDRLEAAARAGRADLVGRWAAELAEYGEGIGASWAVAAAEHGRALVSTGEEAQEHFRAALAAHARSSRVPDRARTQLAYGEHLRRARRRVAAREQLRAALATFEDLGAEPLAARARQELRASGETARRRDTAVPSVGLTAQETHVARLVARGLSNREVAAELFLSPRTVDFHLRNVYTKLGITSRTELAARTRDQGVLA